MREDFGSFTHKTFATIRPGDPFKPNWLVEAITWDLQQVAEGRIRRLIITVTPRHLISICASHAQDLSVELHNLCRSFMQSSWYLELWPRTRFSPAKNTESELKITQGARSLRAVDGSPPRSTAF
ncbi:hypothetical protein [Microvirga makkahensis]|uniref:Uncharacterized protein n=1 Tax=Microvirga makkahensis TaxID=1128670 RepID=A0A7X3MVD9_9HYPH|nr:hypothetical protein [Microvirga makkahensis]MXQ13919.1 hypothetical protein [Microvirga makkahensis]